MEKVREKGLLALILFGSLQLTAQAQDIRAFPCNNCTDTDMESVAVSKGVGIKYVYDLSGGFLSGYHVTREDLQPGQWTLVASPFEPESWMLEQYALLHQFYLTNGNALHGREAVSAQAESGGHVNGYDVTGSSVDRNRVSDYLGGNFTTVFASVMGSFGRAIRLGGILTPDVQLTVQVLFPDGSKAIYKFNWDTKKWEYVPKSAVDSNGNSIPESPEDLVNGTVGSGEFDFNRPGGNPNDLGDFLNRAAGMGIPIIDPTRRMACTNAGGGAYTCRGI